MTDAVARAAGRKAALNAARQALRSGSKSELASALSGLPPDGKKAVQLGIELQKAIANSSRSRTERVKVQGSRALCTSDGVKYEFLLAETGDLSIFRPKRIGTHISVTINVAHPFGQILLENDRWQDPAVLTLLAGWAHYELEQSDEFRRGTIRDARIDWGRVVRRLLASDIGFHQDQLK